MEMCLLLLLPHPPFSLLLLLLPFLSSLPLSILPFRFPSHNPSPNFPPSHNPSPYLLPFHTSFPFFSSHPTPQQLLPPFSQHSCLYIFNDMREQVASPIFSPVFDRKKMSVKISTRDENNDQRRRVNGGYVSYLGEKSIVNMPGGRLKGGSSMDHIVDQDLAGAALEKMAKMNGLEKAEKINGFEKAEKTTKEEELEHESQKRRALDDDLLLQWGHRKRPRCSRLELKQITDESSVLSKKTIRVDRRVVKAEKQFVVGQTHDTVQSRGQASRPCAPPLREVGSSSGRRNVQDFSMLLKGITTSNKDCISSDVRHSLPNAAERPDRHASSSPDKNDTVSACHRSTDNGSPDNAFTIAAVHSGGDPLQSIPFSFQKLDLDSFEWPRILISLSRKEKEDDFMAIKGCKLPQRPKRRPKVVEKALHYCSPGIWLSDLTRGRYDVREKKCVKKKPRGLKAMESSDSESE